MDYAARCTENEHYQASFILPAPKWSIAIGRFGGHGIIIDLSFVSSRQFVTMLAEIVL
jgi:hypothetical protein